MAFVAAFAAVVGYGVYTNRKAEPMSLLLSSCNGEKSRVRKMTCVSSVSELSDTVFFANVENFVAAGEEVFFIDKHRNRIVCVDVDDWAVKRWIGVSGGGPDELCNLSRFTFGDNMLYALDGGCGKLMEYDLQGNIRAKYSLPLESRLMTGYHFSVSKEGRMNISTRSDAGAFVELNLSDGTTSFWEERFRFDYTVQDMQRNGRHLLETADGYIAVSDNMPYIEKYDNQKQKLEVYDYSSIPAVKRRLLRIEREVSDTDSYGIVCEDACVHEDKLYLLLASNDDGGFAVNQIAVFSLFPRIKWDGLLEMSGRIYSAFCVQGNRIITFESRKNRLEVFGL